MSDSPQLTTARLSEDGELTIPLSACEDVDIEPPATVFLKTVGDQIRIVAEVSGVRADDHDPEVAVQQAREARCEPGSVPTYEEMLQSIADQDPYSDVEDVREFFRGE